MTDQPPGVSGNEQKGTFCQKNRRWKFPKSQACCSNPNVRVPGWLGQPGTRPNKDTNAEGCGWHWMQKQVRVLSGARSLGGAKAEPFGDAGNSAAKKDTRGTVHGSEHNRRETVFLVPFLRTFPASETRAPLPLKQHQQRHYKLNRSKVFSVLKKLNLLAQRRLSDHHAEPNLSNGRPLTTPRRAERPTNPIRLKPFTSPQTSPSPKEASTLPDSPLTQDAATQKGPARLSTQLASTTNFYPKNNHTQAKRDKSATSASKTAPTTPTTVSRIKSVAVKLEPPRHKDASPITHAEPKSFQSNAITTFAPDNHLSRRGTFRSTSFRFSKGETALHPSLILPSPKDSPPPFPDSPLTQRRLAPGLARLSNTNTASTTKFLPKEQSGSLVRHGHCTAPPPPPPPENQQKKKLVDMCADVRRLPILEALYIKDINPKLSVQANDQQALPSMNRTKANNSLLTEKQSEESTTNKRRPLTETKINEKQKLSANQRRPLGCAAARLNQQIALHSTA
ncbi:hypothetical protein GWK47_049505 [Chionoecetes opilio]|uniref:Uncharacterized protein n=1 Tax=Chionoecetes opilio TaxID=41210 RepID=A0A8J5CRN4_CHIOP|nr:hypothetical protein GWK47_049505 [Chionoecetes opilio]